MSKRSAFAVYKENQLLETKDGEPMMESDIKENESSLISEVVKENKRKKRKRQIIEDLTRKKKKRKTKVASSRKNDESDEYCLNEDEFVENLSLSSEVKDLPFFDMFDPSSYSDSRAAAQDLFKLLINPLPMDKFFSNVWEKRPVILQRHRPHYNQCWFSTKELDSILHNEYLEFTTNIDLTTYVGGVRTTHNPTGRAVAATVWDHFKRGCSVRLLNPQTYSTNIWLLNSTLQELFKCCMGANVYLTPAGSQGFSPHYDDIEAFVMQLEGKKKWKLYQPREKSECLPRFSSPNFTEADIGDPILEVVLEPGDLLYFPRGVIHQAATLSDSHSLHITLSTFQKNTWGDYLEKLLPASLEVAMQEDVEFRSGLPLEYLDYTGIVHSDSNDPRREAFFKKLSGLFAKLCKFSPVDAAADQMGADFIQDCLPPFITEEEASVTISENGHKWEDGKVVDGIELTGDTKVKLIRSEAVRLVLEEEETVLYHTVQNSRLYHEKQAKGVKIQDDEAPGVEYLILSYPNYVPVASIPIENGSTHDKIDLCRRLYYQGLLFTLEDQ